MVEEEEKLPPEVKKDLLKEGWIPPDDAPEVLGAGEGQEKQSLESSSEAIEAGAEAKLISKEARNEAVDKPALSSREAKDLAKSLLEEGYAINIVEDKTGLSAPTVRGLKGALAKKTKKKTQEEKKETRKPEEKGKPLVPYAEMGEPEEFLRGFLEGYGFKDRFIDLLCRRVVLREELPHPNDLAADLLSMEGSGVKSARNAGAIAEDYAYAFKKYKGEMEEQNRPHTMGYDVHPPERSRYPGGIPVHEDYERPRHSRGIPMREPHDRGEERRHDGRDMDQPVTMKEFILWQKEEDLRQREERLREDDGGRRRDEAPDWMRDRMEKMEEKIRQQDEERMERLEKQLEAARNTPPPAGVSREDVANLIENVFDARSKKLTTEDVQRIIRDQTAEFRVGLTKDDLDYLKAKDEFRLEERKLDEKGKTRDELANIARGGFSQIGQIVARTLTEAGATTGTPTKGMADQTGTILQVNCPGCGAAITSPITENMVTCSQCGRRYTVERPPHETLPPPEPPKEKASMEAGFSVESPPIPTEPTPPMPEEKPEEPVHVKPEEFTTEEKKEIKKSLEDAKEGRITPLEISEPTTDAPKIINEPTTDAPKIINEPTTDASDVEKIAECIAIGAAADKLEEELKKEEKPIEKKPMPEITSNECPICGKKCRSQAGVRLHAAEIHPEYQ